MIQRTWAAAERGRDSATEGPDSEDQPVGESGNKLDSWILDSAQCRQTSGNGDGLRNRRLSVNAATVLRRAMVNQVDKRIEGPSLLQGEGKAVTQELVWVVSQQQFLRKFSVQNYKIIDKEWSWVTDKGGRRQATQENSRRRQKMIGDVDD